MVIDIDETKRLTYHSDIYTVLFSLQQLQPFWWKFQSNVKKPPVWRSPWFELFIVHFSYLPPLQQHPLQVSPLGINSQAWNTRVGVQMNSKLEHTMNNASVFRSPPPFPCDMAASRYARFYIHPAAPRSLACFAAAAAAWNVFHILKPFEAKGEGWIERRIKFRYPTFQCCSD
jgi:hypothetical protein